MEQTNTTSNNSNNPSMKRNTAYKLRIGDVLKGKPQYDETEGKFLFITLGEKKISRTNILANCIDKYIQDGEKKYATLTVDDASGQLQIKTFGEDIEQLKSINQGDTLQLIGNIREWNGEIYMIPEVIKKVDPKWLLVRKIEIQNTKKDLPVTEETEIRNKILTIIKEAETEGGIDKDKLLLDLEENSDATNTEIKKLLEEGLIYEPRPERLRYLG